MSKLHPKHEIIRCDRCSTPFECKANSFSKCQCSKVPLTINETQYISENFEGCLCAECLAELKREYQNILLENQTKRRKLAEEIKNSTKSGVKPNIDEIVAEVNIFRAEQ